MADPTKYTPGYDYSDFEASNPTLPKPGAQLDNDFANIATSIDETIDALKDVRRSDGKLKNEIVTVDSLSTDVRSLLGEDEYLDIVGENIASVVTVADSIEDVNALAPLTAQIAALAPITASIQAVGAVDDQVVTVAGIAANVTTVAGVAANVSTVAGIAGSVTAVAAIDDDVALVAANIVAVQNASANAASAAASAGAASTSAGNAAASATLAGRWATAPEDEEVVPGSGLFSAFNWYRKTLAIYNSVSAGLAATIHGATAKPAMIDADEFGYWDSVSGALRKLTLANLVTSVFDGSRKIANGWFNGDTFRIYKAATAFYSWFDAATLTGARKITLPDRDITLGMTAIAAGTLTVGSAAFDVALPAGPRRFLILINSLRTNGTSVPGIQLKSGGAAEGSGYLGAAANSGSASGLANGTAIFFNSGNSATASYFMRIELIFMGGTTWLVVVDGSHSLLATVQSSGTKTLAGVLDGIRFRQANGTETIQDGAYQIYGEY